MDDMQSPQINPQEMKRLNDFSTGLGGNKNSFSPVHKKNKILEPIGVGCETERKVQNDHFQSSANMPTQDNTVHINPSQNTFAISHMKESNIDESVKKSPQQWKGPQDEYDFDLSQSANSPGKMDKGLEKMVEKHLKKDQDDEFEDMISRIESRIEGDRQPPSTLIKVDDMAESIIEAREQELRASDDKSNDSAEDFFTQEFQKPHGVTSPRAMLSSPRNDVDAMPNMPDIGHEINNQSSSRRKEESDDPFDHISDNYNLEDLDEKKPDFQKDKLDDDLDDLF